MARRTRHSKIVVANQANSKIMRTKEIRPFVRTTTPPAISTASPEEEPVSEEGGEE